MITRYMVCCLGLLTAPCAARAASFDLNGDWSYTISGLKVTGMCPLGSNATGTAQITQTGASFTLVLLTGSVCDPASMCSFAGTVAGATYTGSNTDVVDNEGGTVTNTLTFTATSAAAASGSGTSVYQHPGGMSCTWTKNITLTRTAPTAGGPDAAGGQPGPDAGLPDASGARDATPQTDDDDGGGCSLAPATTGRGCPAAVALLMLVAMAMAWRLRRQ